MRIAVVSQNCCMRATQTSLAAKAAGHTIHAIVHISAHTRQYNEVFDSTATFLTPQQLYEGIRNARPDIIHVHDRPHKLPAEVIGAKLGAPIVHDVHDMFSLMVPGEYHGEDSDYEEASLKNADGLVFVSEDNERYAREKYGELPPTVVVKSGVLSALYPRCRLPRVSGGVWGGGLEAHEAGDPRLYIDQRNIVARFSAIGQSAFIYYAPCEPGTTEKYHQAGAMIGGMCGYQEMLHDYTRYDFGWYGQTEDHPQIHGTLPNKLFEYLAAGIPVVVINAREAGKMVEAHGLGIHIRRPEDLVYHKHRLEPLRLNVWHRRYDWTREKECEKLWPLYERLTGKPGKVVVSG